MNSIKTLERLQRVHRFIEQQNTGTPQELASRLRLSVRTVHHLIDHLKDYKAVINYDRSRKTYFYEEDFSFQVSLSLSINGVVQPSGFFHRQSA